jgi:hypothetical protein
MRRLALATIACVLVNSSSAHAGLDLTWNACNTGTGRAADVTFPCADRTAVERLFGCFQVPEAMPQFFVLDVVLDLQVEDASLPPFWRFEPFGCNESGLGASPYLPDSPGICDGVLWPWGQAEDAVPLEIQFQTGFGSASRARILIHLFRPSTYPFPLDANANYFAFYLAFSFGRAAEAGGTCAGCPSRLAIVWNSAQAFGTDGQVLTVIGAGRATQCATVNGAGSATCAATPVKKVTWTALKSIYR